MFRSKCNHCGGSVPVRTIMQRTTVTTVLGVGRQGFLSMRKRVGDFYTIPESNSEVLPYRTPNFTTVPSLPLNLRLHSSLACPRVSVTSTGGSVRPTRANCAWRRFDQTGQRFHRKATNTESLTNCAPLNMRDWQKKSTFQLNMPL